MLLPPSPRRSAGGSGSALKPLATCTSAAAAAAASVRTATMVGCGGRVYDTNSEDGSWSQIYNKRECTAMHLRRVLSAGLVCGATCFAPASAPSALRLSSAVALRAPAGVRAGRCVSSAHAHAEHARCHRRVARGPPSSRARAGPAAVWPVCRTFASSGKALSAKGRDSNVEQGDIGGREPACSRSCRAGWARARCGVSAVRDARVVRQAATSLVVAALTTSMKTMTRTSRCALFCLR